MKKTLLEIVVDILNDLDSDLVNSIDDTIESQQVAQIVRSSYEEMMSNRNWPHLKKLTQLNTSNDASKPNYLKIPDKTKHIEYVEYDVRGFEETTPKYKIIKYKDNESFLRLISARTGDNVVQVQDFSGVSLAIRNDKDPEYYTSFDDEYLVFDSFNVDVNQTLIKAKTRCLAYIQPAWEHSDDFTPNLPDDAFSALIEESKSVAFYSLKQMVNQKAEQRAARQQRWLSRKAWRVNGGIQYPNYGRKQ